MPIAHESFTFVNADRTFTCSVEGPTTLRSDSWWWFEVSTERHQHQRHAPFRAAMSDTRDNVCGRIVAYYDDLLARRAAPPVTRWNQRPGGWKRPADSAVVPSAVVPSAPAAPQPSPETLA